MLLKAGQKTWRQRKREIKREGQREREGEKHLCVQPLRFIFSQLWDKLHSSDDYFTHHITPSNGIKIKFPSQKIPSCSSSIAALKSRRFDLSVYSFTRVDYLSLQVKVGFPGLVINIYQFFPRDLQEPRMRACNNNTWRRSNMSLWFLLMQISVQEIE